MSSIVSLRARLMERLRRGEHGVVGLVLLAAAVVFAESDVAWARTWFYVLAWYPALLLIDALTMRRRGRSLLADRPLALLCAWCWSIPFWLLFEALNLRIENWYYVNAPASLLESRLLLVLAFGTVLPALFELFDLLGSFPSFDRARFRGFRVTPVGLNLTVVAGVVLLLALLAAPRYCFAFTWVFVPLLLEPFNRRASWPSLLRDLEHGRLGRLLRLVVAGAIAGLMWETFNLPAWTRWIYTVPFFEKTFAVEMPLFGFLGFLPFALEAYSAVRALEILGLSAPFEDDARGRVALDLHALPRLFLVPLPVVIFTIVTITELETASVDSRLAEVKDLPGIKRREAALLELADLSAAEQLARRASDESGQDDLSRLLLIPRARIAALADAARVATLRGIGAANAKLLAAAGVLTIDDLAAEDPDQLYLRLAEADGGARVRPQRVRVWVHAARARRTE